MGAPRRRPIIKSRKRMEEEGEEEGGTLQAPEDDSMSENSVGSDADDDADAEASNDSGTELSAKDHIPTATVVNGHQEKLATSTSRHISSPPVSALATTTADTEAMMNGLKISRDSEPEEIQFDDMNERPEAQQPLESQESQSIENPAERRRREHDEYRRRRDADPAFVPNRGGFFMHDHRSAGPGQNGFRPFGRGGARGRGTPRGAFQGLSHTQPSGPADAPWAHDLHDTIVEPRHGQDPNRPSASGTQPKQHALPSQTPNRTFSTTTRLGDMQVRLFLHGMAEPRTFPSVARYSYTRLPVHRPPLRRDKPVRVSIPAMDNKYIFPAADRSFIFIPRALRPNQQGFGRGRGRGSFSAGYASFGPSSSRRTSVYGGSTYSPSAILSRRSSIARDVTVPVIAPPTRAPMFQQATTVLDTGKPVVRLPPAAEQLQQHSISSSPTVQLPQTAAYGLAPNPKYQENRPTDLPMHHPKPERSLQVADIVSPTTTELNPPAAQQHPFHQQVPLHMPSQAYPPGLPQYPHTRHPSHPSQASGSTPLPQIPEAAINAQPFQPFGYPSPQSFYPTQYPLYYYPPTGQPSGSPAAAPFVPGQQYYYPMTVPPPPPPQAESNSQAGTVAHEAGGMVYYYNPSDLASGPENSSTYPSNYSTAPSAGVEGLAPTPFYPQNSIYYPPQPQ